MSTPEHPFAPLSEGSRVEVHDVPGGYLVIPVEPAPGVVELTSTGHAYAAELEDLLQRRDELEDQITAAKAAIQAEMGDAEEATIAGRPAFTWKRHTRRSFDQAAARKLLGPEGTAACQRTTEVRTFRRAGE